MSGQRRSKGINWDVVEKASLNVQNGLLSEEPPSSSDLSSPEPPSRDVTPVLLQISENNEVNKHANIPSSIVKMKSMIEGALRVRLVGCMSLLQHWEDFEISKLKETTEASEVRYTAS